MEKDITIKKIEELYETNGEFTNDIDTILLKHTHKNLTRDIENSVNEIKKAYYIEDELPYFFIVGAGISSPQVKLASQIVDDCKKMCKENSKEDKEASINKSYSYWFSKAFPHREMRRRYLNKLIKNKKLPEASLKLAQILASRKVTNLVVTTNFDKFIFEALNVYGERNILVADCPQSVSKLNLGKEYINILHVHGTYEFYDLCNLEGEIEDRADNDEFFSIKSYLRNILVEKSPIVIGYSGWETDVIMTVLKERLKLPLKQKLYWFCYSENEYERIPGFLRENNDVVFILAPDYMQEGRVMEMSIGNAEKEVTAKKAKNEKLKDNSKEFLSNNDIDDEISKVNRKQNLDAVRVFNEFIKCFNITMPDIINNPINFLKEYYKERLGKNYYALISLGLMEYNNNYDENQKNKIIKIKDCIFNRNFSMLSEIT